MDADCVNEAEIEQEDVGDISDHFQAKPSSVFDEIASEPQTQAASWRALGLSQWLIGALNELNLRHPTPVQENCIPHVMDGQDVLGCAKTGTGKTLAFALPIIQKLSVDPYGVFALVLTPTRELAFQLDDQFRAYGRSIGLTTAVIVGGRMQMSQAQDLSRRPHVIVATPGRLADHIESNTASLTALFRGIKFFVLDEADRLLDGQYAMQLQTIFRIVPKQRQTLLFSATITSALEQLHQVSVRKPFFYREEAEDHQTVDRLDQRYVVCPRAVRDTYLVYVVKNFCARRPDSLVIVFAASCRECHALSMVFRALGFEVGCLHSQITQRARLSSLARFRSNKIRILICTDVAARGLDIPHVDLVVNHNVPRTPKTYVHRIGRSARAGRFGAAITFVSQYDLELLKAIEAAIGKQLEQLSVDDRRVSTYAARVLATKREAEIRMDRSNFGEKKEQYKRKELVSKGWSSERINSYIDEMKRRNTCEFTPSSDRKQTRSFGKKTFKKSVEETRAKDETKEREESLKSVQH